MGSKDCIWRLEGFGWGRGLKVLVKLAGTHTVNADSGATDSAAICLMCIVGVGSKNEYI